MRLTISLILLNLFFSISLSAQNYNDTLNIDSITVVARKPLMTFKKTGNISIDIDQLKYAPLFGGEKDIFKFLQLMPGVNAGKDGMSGLLVRGGSNDQTLILLDDVPIYNQAHAFGIVSIFSGEVIKSADVSKGFISPAYGSRLSAITQISTRDGNYEKHQQSLTVGTLSLSATVDGPIIRNKGSYLISGRYFLPGAILPLVGAPIRFGFYDATAKIAYNIHKQHKISANFYIGSDKMHNKDQQDWNGFSWGNTTTSIRLESNWSERFNSSAIVYYTYLQNKQESVYKSDQENIKNWGRTTFKTHEIGAKLIFNNRLSNIYLINYGANFSQQRFFPMKTTASVNGEEKEKSYPSGQLSSGALFFNNNIQLGELSTQIGVRAAFYDNSKKRAFSIEPRAQLSYDFRNNYQMWVSATMNSQALVQFPRYYYSMPIDFWAPFEGEKLQHSWQITLGARKKLKNNLTVSIETFYKNMRNLPLIYDSDDFLLGNGGFVYGKGTAYGAEMMLQYQTGLLSLISSYTYTRSERNSNGVCFPFEFDIPHDFNAFASYDIIKQNSRKHTLSLNVSWHSGLPYRLTDESYPDFEGNPIIEITPYPSMRMKNFFRTDISYNMEKRKKNGTRNWQISLVNATYHKNPVNIYPKRGSYKATMLIPIIPSFSYTRTF